MTHTTYRNLERSLRKGGMILASPSLEILSTPVFTYGGEFFQLPKEEKKKVGGGRGVRGGYREIRYEKVGGSPGEPPREIFYYVPEDTRMLPIVGLRETLRELYEYLSSVGEMLVENVDKQFKTDILPNLKKARHGLQLAYYRNEEVDPKRIIYPPHRDYSLFTFFLGGAKDGLEVDVGAGWEKAKLHIFEMFVAPGTKLTHCTGIKATPHRVLAHSKERLSITFSVEPDPQFLLGNGETAQEFNDRVYRKIYRQ